MKTSNWKHQCKIWDSMLGFCDEIPKLNSYSCNSQFYQVKLSVQRVQSTLGALQAQKTWSQVSFGMWQKVSLWHPPFLAHCPGEPTPVTSSWGSVPVTAAVHWPGHVQHGLHDVVAGHRAALVEHSLVLLPESTTSTHGDCQLSTIPIHPQPWELAHPHPRNPDKGHCSQEGGCYPAGVHTLLTNPGEGEAFSALGAKPQRPNRSAGGVVWENICPGYLDSLIFLLWVQKSGNTFEALFSPTQGPRCQQAGRQGSEKRGRVMLR